MAERMFERKAHRVINTGWAHGRYLDYWSLVHFLTGVMMGITASFLGLPAIISVVTIGIIATLYESLEILSRVAEDIENVVSDIVAVVLGSVLVLYVFEVYALDAQWKSLFLAIAVGINIVLIHLGWKSYLMRKSRRKGSYRYLKLVLYIITLISIKIAVTSFYFWSAHSAY